MQYTNSAKISFHIGTIMAIELTVVITLLWTINKKKDNHTATLNMKGIKFIKMLYNTPLLNNNWNSGTKNTCYITYREYSQYNK